MEFEKRLRRILTDDIFTEGDIVRMLVIWAFVLISFMMTASAPASSVDIFHPLLYYIPIILISLWYPRQSLKFTITLVLGFLSINIFCYYSGAAIDFILSCLYATMFFWVLGAVSLFPRHAVLAASRYQELIENARDAKFICDTGTMRVLAVNERCADVLGYAPSDLVGMAASRLWAYEEELAAFRAEMQREGYVGNLETAFLTQSGGTHRILLSCRALLHENSFECTIVDVGRLWEERHDSIQANSDLQHLALLSHDIVFVQDADGKYTHLSWTNAHIFGVDPAGMIGRMPQDFMQPEAAARHLEQFRAVVTTGSTASFEITLDADDAPHVFSIILAPMFGEGGAVTGVVGIARDITELKQRTLACMQLEWEIDHWKEVLVTVAHEMRTPLQPVIGYIRLILDDAGANGLNRETQKMLERCLESAEHERAIVDRMLEFSLLSREKEDLRITDIRLRDLVETVIADGGYAQQAEIWNEVPEGYLIRGDHERMYQVLESLISNAIKYNKPPKNVWIRCARSNDNQYIMVCDNGIGIPEESLRSIFRPFYVVGAAKLNRKGGRIGLGLSIAKKYILIRLSAVRVQGQQFLRNPLEHQ
ncbi:hypothetical protein ASZ90_010638 [hydrocarbon metagenome]|uniref:histidine kinase n=1 Tax=hydrocarbon metagenome TaxID=938273 RepID=A0A0W8FFK2_9ZZZZ